MKLWKYQTYIVSSNWHKQSFLHVVQVLFLGKYYLVHLSPWFPTHPHETQHPSMNCKPLHHKGHWPCISSFSTTNILPICRAELDAGAVFQDSPNSFIPVFWVVFYFLLFFLFAVRILNVWPYWQDLIVILMKCTIVSEWAFSSNNLADIDLFLLKIT